MIKIFSMCIYLVFSFPLFSTEIKTVKIIKKENKIKQKNFAICKQKVIPMKVEQFYNAPFLTIKLTAEQKISNFTLKSVRGIDGVVVKDFKEILEQVLDTGDLIESTVEISNFRGLVYVILDISLVSNGIIRTESIPIALGSLSKSQIKERSKNIKIINPLKNEKEGANSLSLPPKRIHEMKID